jgi:hypothetical protein
VERVRKVDRGHGEALNVPTHSVKVVTLQWKKTGRAVAPTDPLAKGTQVGGGGGEDGQRGDTGIFTLQQVATGDGHASAETVARSHPLPGEREAAEWRNTWTDAKK